MAAQDTLIPGGVSPQRTAPITVVPDSQTGQYGPGSTGLWSGTDPYAATMVALAGAVRAGKGGSVLAGVLAGLVSSAALWGLHDAVGGRAEAARMESLEDRIEVIERQQAWERWALTSIARKVGAELPPEGP